MLAEAALTAVIPLVSEDKRFVFAADLILIVGSGVIAVGIKIFAITILNFKFSLVMSDLAITSRAVKEVVSIDLKRKLN